MSKAAEDVTVWVVRHAEKAKNQSDPQLSALGQKRAEVMAEMFKHFNLEKIYSTPYRRTQETAAPTAKSHSLTIESYAAGEGSALIKAIVNSGHNALIVGHSNTVPDIVRAAGGEAPDLTERDYGDVFQLTIFGEHVETTRWTIPVTDASQLND